MKPRVITLPDSLRDKLEAQLSGSTHASKNVKFVTEQEASLRAVLYPETMSDEDRPFLRDLQESLLTLHDCSGSPVLLFKNLPPTKGLEFSQALSRFLGSGSYEIFVAKDQTPEAQDLHNDKSYPGIKERRKSLVAMHCVDPGEVPQPTVFATADELIARWAERLIEQGHDAKTARKDVIDVLSNVECDSHRLCFPLLVQNPNYKDGNNAPEFFLQKPNYILLAPPSILAQSKKELKKNIAEILDEICHSEAPHSESATQDNTMTLYNDAAILHARGPSKDGARQYGRRLIAHDALPLLHYRDPESYATAGPHSKAVTDRKWYCPDLNPFQR